MKNALASVCLSALLVAPAVAQTSTTTTPAETPAATAPAPATPAPDAASDTTATEAAGAMDATVADTTQTPSEVVPESVEYVTNETAGSVYSSDLVGQAVYGTEDEKVGDINDLLLDQGGNVEAVIIGVGGFIGLGEKDVAVTLESLTIASTDSAYRISIRATEQDLEEAPTFTRADGTSSDRLGAFERAYTRTRVEAEKALDEAGRRANELYEQGRQAVDELTKSDDSEAEKTTETPAPAQ